MITQAVRIYGVEDTKLESFELPEIKEDEILASVQTDSMCMSTWKLLQQGAQHKKAPDDLQTSPVIIGHEFCGDIIEVGSKWREEFTPGDKYVVQANLQLPDRPDCPGYSYSYSGGDATYIIIPNDVMKQGCLLPYKGDSYFKGSTLEPLSTIIGAFNANYHLIPGTYTPKSGIKQGGNLLLMGATGPMGYLAVDYAIHGPRKPKNLVVTGRTAHKIEQMEKLYPPELAEKQGVNLQYINTGGVESQLEQLQSAIIEEAYDDIFVLVPSRELVEIGTGLLADDGCFNFFAGPKDKYFEATINFYDIHYRFTHYVGTSGANVNDMEEAVYLVENDIVDTSKIITHVLGLNEVAKTTIDLPNIGGGKKLAYVQKNLPLTALDDIGEKDVVWKKELEEILKANDYKWSKEAESYILSNAPNIKLD